MSDTIGWVMDQLDPRGDVVNLAVSVADIMIVTVPFSCGATAVKAETVAIGARSYPSETRLSQVVRDLKIVTPTAVARFNMCA